MARALGTYHVPFPGHSGIDIITLPSFACAERRRSGQNHVYLCLEFGISFSKFHKLGGSHVHEDHPPPLCHVHFCTAKRQLQQWNVPTHGGKQSIKFEPCVTRGLTCSLKRMKRGANHVHVPSTCNVHRAQHVQCAPQISFYSSS